MSTVKSAQEAEHVVPVGYGVVFHPGYIDGTLQMSYFKANLKLFHITYELQLQKCLHSKCSLSWFKCVYKCLSSIPVYYSLEDGT